MALAPDKNKRRQTANIHRSSHPCQQHPEHTFTLKLAAATGQNNTKNLSSSGGVYVVMLCSLNGILVLKTL